MDLNIKIFILIVTEKNSIVHAYCMRSQPSAHISHQLSRVGYDKNRALFVAKGLDPYFVFILYFIGIIQQRVEDTNSYHQYVNSLDGRYSSQKMYLLLYIFDKLSAKYFSPGEHEMIVHFRSKVIVINRILKKCRRYWIKNLPDVHTASLYAYTKAGNVQLQQ
jgi:hypothetical protein